MELRAVRKGDEFLSKKEVIREGRKKVGSETRF